MDCQNPTCTPQGGGRLSDLSEKDIMGLRDPSRGVLTLRPLGLMSYGSPVTMPIGCTLAGELQRLQICD